MSLLNAVASASSSASAVTGEHPALARSWLTSDSTAAAAEEPAGVEGVAVGCEGAGACVVREGVGAGALSGVREAAGCFDAVSPASAFPEASRFPDFPSALSFFPSAEEDGPVLGPAERSAPRLAPSPERPSALPLVSRSLGPSAASTRPEGPSPVTA